jgi:hypothetical protein
MIIDTNSTGLLKNRIVEKLIELKFVIDRIAIKILGDITISSKSAGKKVQKLKSDFK